MTELKCKNCGAPLTKDGKCQYCGSVYDIPKDPTFIPVLIQNARANVFQASVSIPMQATHYMSNDEIADFAVDELKHKLSEALAGNMEIKVNKDPVKMITTFRGTVRILSPNYLF